MNQGSVYPFNIIFELKKFTEIELEFL